MTDVFKDTTTYSLFFELVDSTTGLPKTGIVYTDVTGSYVRTRSVRVPISMSILTGPADGFSAGGFILIDDTNQPGIYRLDVPAGAFATGAFEVVISVKATGCRTVSRQINLVNINNQVAYAPNVAASGAGGLLDTLYINGSSTAAANLALSAAAIVVGIADSGTTSSIPSISCTPIGTVADQFKGRIMIFRSDTTTTALRGQATDITASSNAAAPTFTVTPLTTAPASGDVFVIV